MPKYYWIKFKPPKSAVGIVEPARLNTEWTIGARYENVDVPWAVLGSSETYRDDELEIGPEITREVPIRAPLPSDVHAWLCTGKCMEEVERGMNVYVATTLDMGISDLKTALEVAYRTGLRVGATSFTNDYPAILAKQSKS